jgi:hypothetical protein
MFTKFTTGCPEASAAGPSRRLLNPPTLHFGEWAVAYLLLCRLRSHRVHALELVILFADSAAQDENSSLIREFAVGKA